jgi:hypothetical protein
MIMRWVLPAVVMSWAVGLTLAADEKYTSKEGRFAATFPGKPTTTTSKAGQIDLNITLVDQGGSGFAVIFSDLPADAVKVTKPKDLLDGGEKGLVTNFKAKVSQSTDFPFGPDKLPAREIRAEKENLQLRLMIILAENRLYQVFVVGTKETVTGKAADDFFMSFAITK